MDATGIAPFHSLRGPQYVSVLHDYSRGLSVERMVYLVMKRLFSIDEQSNPYIIVSGGDKQSAIHTTVRGTFVMGWLRNEKGSHCRRDNTDCIRN
jgi:hypothetical protein